MDVIWTDRARLRLKEINAYIARDQPRQNEVDGNGDEHNEYELRNALQNIGDAHENLLEGRALHLLIPCCALNLCGWKFME